MGVVAQRQNLRGSWQSLGSENIQLGRDVQNGESNKRSPQPLGGGGGGLHACMLPLLLGSPLPPQPGTPQASGAVGIQMQDAV